MIHSIDKRIHLPWRRHIFSNVAEGTHAGQVTRTLEAAVNTRYLLGKNGSEASQVAICGAGDLPLGVITDQGAMGDLVNVALPGSASSTVLMVASEPIAIGEAVYTAASGKIQNEPATPGSYYEVGRALTSASGDNQLVEVDPIEPRQLAIINAFSGTASTDLAMLAAVFETGPDKLIVLPE